MKFKSEISILCFALLVWAAEGEQIVWAAAGWTGEGWWSLPALSSPPHLRLSCLSWLQAKHFLFRISKLQPLPLQTRITVQD